MIILCCPVTLYPATRESLARYAPDALIVPIPADDITRPWADYAAHWGTDDLLVVEQDVILHQGVIPQLEPGRFASLAGPAVEVAEALPVDALAEVARGIDGLHRLDGHGEAGEAAGFKLHVHWPSVGHREFPPGEWERDAL